MAGPIVTGAQLPIRLIQIKTERVLEGGQAQRAGASTLALTMAREEEKPAMAMASVLPLGCATVT